MKLTKNEIAEFRDVPTLHFATFDPKSNLIKVSDNWTETLGHQISYLCKLDSLLEIIHENDLKQGILAYLKLEAGKPLTNQVTRLKKRDGGDVTITWEAWKAPDGKAYFTAREDEWLDDTRAIEDDEHKELAPSLPSSEFHSSLTDTESRILSLFMNSGGSPIDREVLLREVYLSTKVQPHTINVHICNLRRKIQSSGLGIRKISRSHWVFENESQKAFSTFAKTDHGPELTRFAINKIRDPLATISCAAELLILSEKDPESIAVFDKVVRRQEKKLNTHMADIIDSTLMTARNNTNHEDLTYDVGRVLSETLEKASSLFQEEGHTPLLQIQRPELIATGDPSRLSRVLEKVMAFVSPQLQPKGVIEFNCMEEKNRILILIHFEGPKDISLEKVRGCQSLGYPLIKKTLNLNLADIDFFKRVPQKGNCFRISLPKGLETAKSDKKPVQDLTQLEIPSKRKRILIVDDNLDLVETLSIFLRLKGHTVDATTSGAKALAMAKLNSPDVALIDLAMPEIDGFMVASALREDDEFKGTNLIAFSCFPEKKYREKARKAGFDHFISKPLQLKDLIAAL